MDIITIANVQSEYAAIRCCLLCREIPAALSSLRPADFTDSTSRSAWMALEQAHAMGGTLGYRTLEKALGSASAASVDKACRQSGADPANADIYARDLIDATIRRGVIDRAQQAAKIAMDMRAPIEQAVSALSADGIHMRSGRQYPTIGELLSQAVTYLESPREMMTRQVIRTGIMPLDDMTGGLSRGLVTILAGRPGTGKSTLALNIAVNAARFGMAVLYVSLEDVAHYLSLRALAMLTDSDYRRLTRHEVDDDTICVAKNALSEFGALPLWTDFLPRQTASSIRASALLRKHEYGLDLLIVDHLTELANDHDAYASTSAQVKGIRDIAKEVDCAVLLLCQLNRKGADRADSRPMVTDLRDSGKIEEVARNIWLLHRPNQGGDCDNVIDVGIAKATHGQTGVVRLNCDLSKMRIW